MSAYLVGNDHLDLIASAPHWSKEGGVWLYARQGILPPRSDLPFTLGEGFSYTKEHAQGIKNELWLENWASLQARYPKDSNNYGVKSQAQPFRLIADYQATFPEMLGALSCYEYQASESATWYNSFAFHLIQAIRKSTCRLIAGSHWDYTRNREEVSA